MRGKLVKILGRLLPERKHPAEKKRQSFPWFAVVNSLQWLTVILLVILAGWILGGNLLAAQQEKEIEREFSEWKKQFTKIEPNDAALKMRALVAKLGISSVVSTPEFSIDAYTESHPDFRLDETGYKAFEDIQQALEEYLEEQLGKDNEEVDAPPEKLRQYLKSQAAVIEAIGNHVRDNEVPRWQTDITYILSGNYSWESPSYLGLANLQKILALDILEKQRQGRARAASEMLEVSWKINQSVRNLPDLTGQRVAIIVGRYPTGVMRKLDNLPAEWQQRLREHDYRKSLLKSVEGEFMIFFYWSKNKALIHEYFRPLYQPYIRLAAIDYITVGRRTTAKVYKQNVCSFDAVEIDDRVAWWNLLKNNFVGSFIDRDRKAAKYMLDLELNQKILQVKELAAKAGQWPKSVPERSSLICPGFQWVYHVSPDGTMSISLSKQPEWVVERLENHSSLPLSYSVRTTRKTRRTRNDANRIKNQIQQN